ncbi:MAG: hypothetical protein PHE93_04015 [Clostridia bacterium]|nr:hypothetical protein [Clostridia bacterium]
MKKKGLLILPLAMMLIIAVALSTATYAWFAVSADAKISTLTVQTSASDGLQIASIYDATAKSGSMTYNSTTKAWDGATIGYGAELSFTTAMASAYGVTGDGLAANMYTAASRTVTSYLTVPTNAAWYDANRLSMSGNEVYYSNASGTTFASAGNYFTLGVWSGDEGIKEATITEGNTGTTPFYVRVQAYPTTQVTSANAASYTVADTFYSDSTGLTTANDLTYFTDGVWRGEVTLADDIALYTTATTNNIYVRSSVETYEVETHWTYEANNGALNGSASPYYLVPATANSEYFSLNFALKTQRGMVASAEKEGTADIFLKKLTITASGGMAAASRIAIYSYDIDYTTPQLKYFYIPFSKSAYDATWTNVLATAETNYRIIGDAVIEDAGYSYAATSTSTLNALNIIADGTPVYSTDQWQTATMYMIDKNADWPTKTDYDDAQGVPSTTLNSLGEFSTANSTLFYQLVIWFEGTDSECIGSFAGTGITIDLAFDFYQQWK